MTAQALLNGRAAPEALIDNRGLHYGDGIFRTLQVRCGQPLAWAAHWQRLCHDCERLFLPIPDENALIRECRSMFTDSGDGVLKIIITRGAQGRGYTPAQTAGTDRLLLRYPYSKPWPNALPEIGVCALRLGRNPLLAGIKHLNRLEQVLARRECAQAGWAEALLLDVAGRIISGTMSNVFIVKNQTLETPKLDYAGVVGATRQRIIAAAEEAGIRCVEKKLRLGDCLDADELFLCNSLMGVCAVKRLQDRQFAQEELIHWCQQQLALTEQ